MKITERRLRKIIKMLLNEAPDKEDVNLEAEFKALVDSSNGNEDAAKNIAKYFVDISNPTDSLDAMDTEKTDKIEKEWRAKAKAIISGGSSDGVKNLANGFFSIVSYGRKNIFMGERITPSRIKPMLALFPPKLHDKAVSVFNAASAYQKQKSASDSDSGLFWQIYNNLSKVAQWTSGARERKIQTLHDKMKKRNLLDCHVDEMFHSLIE